jgi:hypothetical protein
MFETWKRVLPKVLEELVVSPSVLMLKHHDENRE